MPLPLPSASPTSAAISDRQSKPCGARGPHPVAPTTNAKAAADRLPSASAQSPSERIAFGKAARGESTHRAPGVAWRTASQVAPAPNPGATDQLPFLPEQCRRSSPSTPCSGHRQCLHQAIASTPLRHQFLPWQAWTPTLPHQAAPRLAQP